MGESGISVLAKLRVILQHDVGSVRGEFAKLCIVSVTDGTNINLNSFRIGRSRKVTAGYQ